MRMEVSAVKFNVALCANILLFGGAGLLVLAGALCGYQGVRGHDWAQCLSGGSALVTGFRGFYSLLQ